VDQFQLLNGLFSQLHAELKVFGFDEFRSNNHEVVKSDGQGFVLGGDLNKVRRGWGFDKFKDSGPLRFSVEWSQDFHLR
jgi:hypothetical protein